MIDWLFTRFDHIKYKSPSSGEQNPNMCNQEKSKIEFAAIGDLVVNPHNTHAILFSSKQQNRTKEANEKKKIENLKFKFYNFYSRR